MITGNSLKIYHTILVLLIIASGTIFIIYPYVSMDSGYYLSMAREVYNGHIYFKDIATPYNPLAILIFSVGYLFKSSHIYEIGIAINFSVILCNGYLLYHIVKSFGTKINLSIFLALSYVLMCIIYDGNHLMLEPISVCFQLLALLCYIKFKAANDIKFIIFSGVFISLSFLSKQYGLFVLVPISIDMLLTKDFKKILSSHVTLALGMMLPLCTVTFLYYFKYESNLSEILTYLLGKGAELDIGQGTGIGSSIRISSILNSFLLVPLLFLIPVLLYKHKKDATAITMYVLLFAISFSVFYFAAYEHYFQYMFPYAILLLAILWTKKTITLQPWMFHCLCVFGIVMITLKVGSAIKHQIRNYGYQIDNQEKIAAIIPKGSEVYLSGLSPAHYFLNDLKSIQLNRISFSFPGYFYPKTIIGFLDSDDYLIISEDYVPDYESYFSEFQQTTIEVKGYKGRTESLFILKRN